MDKAYLVLADGTVYEGRGFGANISAVGELVFTTGVVGYAETLTNPCHAGQIVLQTFPLAGNYGVIEEDLNGNCAAAGFVVREWCDAPSNFRCECDLDTYLKKQNIPGVCGVDTRAITRKIREEGAMKAAICRSIPEDLSFLNSDAPALPESVFGCTEKTSFPAENAKYSVALLDLGASQKIISEMNALGCSMTAYPANTKAEDILSGKHDGIIVSDGSFHAEAPAIESIRSLMGKIPMLGIGSGHLMMALADGGEISRMKAGHYGSNQPVKDLSGKRCYITAQSHLYQVSHAHSGAASFVNVNDGSCEGMDYPSLSAFSVQFMPESCIGPNDTSFIYKRFISMMGGEQPCR